MKFDIKFNPKETRKSFLYSLVLLAFLKPDSLSYLGLSWLDTLLIVLNGPIIIYLALLLLMRKYKISAISTCIICLFLSLTLSTILVSKDYLTLIKTAGPAIAICMFTDYALQNNPKLYLKTTAKFLGVLYFLNFITILLYYPEGMYQTEYVVGDTYLMGFDNSMIYNLLPLCCFSILYSFVIKNKIFSKSSLSILALMLVSVIYVKTGTGMIQAVTFILLILFVNYRMFKKLLRPAIFFAFFYVSTFLLTVFRIQDYFADFIIGVMGKDLTFTGRTFLWDYAISVIQTNYNLLIGIGAGGRTVLGPNGHAYPHPHSLLLDFMYKGGIIMLFCFIFLTIIFIYKFIHSHSDTVRKIILVTIFVFLLGEIVNSTQYKVFFWATFVLIGYSDRIAALQGEKQIKNYRLDGEARLG
ncbi:O-antigen ligase family protein [Fictibacillus sp. b24]|uniref:O-antigen ligase family protein n=1 Tax=Fictibacillus sp. b24 TaxID=3055863 RepID=UPI0025A0932B|nr:O-antigen ligase family protein [Fictibacillus sp. b24]MDM5314906.1 O-antigen ligase family protein [Fictibacillus sp. b24]